MTRIGQVGDHPDVEDLGRSDCNGQSMLRCNRCQTFTRNKEHFAESSVPCELNCQNCKNLSKSHSGAPAVPNGGDCNTILYTCRRCGRRWWQTNGYFHLWQQVTDPEEWRILNENGYGDPISQRDTWD